jgi:hypothetical protein
MWGSPNFSAISVRGAFACASLPAGCDCEGGEPSLVLSGFGTDCALIGLAALVAAWLVRPMLISTAADDEKI